MKSLLALLVLSLSLACASAPAPLPTRYERAQKAAPSIPGANSQERCLSLLILVYEHGELCGGPSAENFTEAAHMCDDAEGITVDEANTCGMDIITSACGSGPPDSCYGIAEHAASAPVSPSSRTL